MEERSTDMDDIKNDPLYVCLCSSDRSDDLCTLCIKRLVDEVIDLKLSVEDLKKNLGRVEEEKGFLLTRLHAVAT